MGLFSGVASLGADGDATTMGLIGGDGDANKFLESSLGSGYDDCLLIHQKRNNYKEIKF